MTRVPRIPIVTQSGEGLPDVPRFRVGEIVWDDLMRCPAIITRVERDKHGNLGIYLSSKLPQEIEGGRFPWEMSVYSREST